MRKRIALAVVPVCALLGLAACDKIGRSPDEPAGQQAAQLTDTTPEQPADDTPATDTPERPVYTQATSEQATIDWATARDDVASHSGEATGSNFATAAAGDAPPAVPVMLPSGIVLPAGTESDVKFQPLEDGYFAFYPGADYNIVVNGTNEVIGQRAPDVTETPPRYMKTMSGAQVAFTKYGADYLVEFECTHADGEEADCISEEDALSVAGSLVPVRSR